MNGRSKSSGPSLSTSSSVLSTPRLPLNVLPVRAASNQGFGPSSGTSQNGSQLASLAMNPFVEMLKPPAPRFPSFAELVELDREQQATPRSTKQEGLFLNLLRDPRILYAALLDAPDAYEEGVAELLLELITGQKTNSSLTEEQLNLLDRATLEFNQHSHKEPQSLQQKVAPVEKPESADSEEEREIEYHESGSSLPHTGPTIPMPEEEPATHWWQK